MLAAFSVLRYMLGQNISVAWEGMGLTKWQFGSLSNAWMVGYALFQVPAGNWADRRGPRFVLGACVASWSVVTLSIAITPALAAQGSSAWLILLLILRFLLGVSMAATYPVAIRMVSKWFSGKWRTRATAVVLVGAPLGVAIAMPLVASVMDRLGWRATFFATGLLPIPIIVWWWLRAKNRPDDNEDATANVAQAYIVAGDPTREIRPHRSADLRTWLYLYLSDPDMLFLCVAYFFNETVLSMLLSWPFSYIDEVWGKGIVTTGWVASVPFLFAVLTMLSTGDFIDRSFLRRDAIRVRRFVAIGCAVTSGAALLVVADSPNLLRAIAFLTLSVGAQFGSENSYWSTAIDLSRANEGTATGLLNFAGSLGFIAGNVLVPALHPSRADGWGAVFSWGAACAGAACVFWIPIRCKHWRAR
jgi:ACS family glucarate transporter-like MFS transporter